MRPYYEQSGITIYHGDCREVLPSIASAVIFTDPPYGLDFPYLGYNDSRENLQQVLRDVVPEFRRFGRAFVLCGPTQIGLYPQADWVACVTWDTTGSFGECGYNQWTPVLCYGPDGKGFGNVNGMMKTDVLRISGGAGVGFQRTSDERKHTCPKPLNMMRKVMRRFLTGAAPVVDPFMGIGTTLVASKALNHKAIGIEIEERYCEIAARRLAQDVLEWGQFEGIPDDGAHPEADYAVDLIDQTKADPSTRV